MSLSLLLLCLSVIGAFAFVLGRVRAAALSGGRSSAMHSRLSYHGAYAAIWAMLPALTLVCVWLIASPIVIDRLVTKSFPEEVQALPPAELNLSYGMVRSIAHGMRMLDGRELADVDGGKADLQLLLAQKGVPLAVRPTGYMIDAANKYNSMREIGRMVMSAAAIVVSLLCVVCGLRAIAPRFRARNRVEQVILGALIIASSIAVLTTVGIVVSMLSEAARFFSMVPADEFFF